MPGNSIGKLFTVTTFGESHGPAYGCIIDGCPPGLRLTEADIQRELDRRRPGASPFTSQRRELDKVKILSGVFQELRQMVQKFAENIQAYFCSGQSISEVIATTRYKQCFGGR